MNRDGWAHTLCAFPPLFIQGRERGKTMLDDIWEGVAVIIDGEVTYPGEGAE